MKLKSIVIMGVGIVILINIIGTTFFYISFVNLLEEQVADHLNLAAESRVNHIETFLEGKKGRAIDFASDGFIITSLTALEIGEGDSERIKSNLSRYILLNKIPTDKDIYGIEVLNSQGIIVSHSGEEETEEVHKEENKFLKTVFSLGKEGIFVSDIFYDKEFERNAYVVAAPIHTGGEFLGVVIIKMGLETLAEITTDRTGLGETGEIYILNRNGLLITPSRFLGGNAGILTQEVDTENSRECFEDIEEYFNPELEEVEEHEDELLTYKDYRGEKVLGVHSYIPENDWCLLAQIDKSEVLGQAKITLLVISIVIILITSILVSLIAVFIGKIFERRKERR